MDYLKFAWRYRRALGFGVWLTSFSGFGQTFILALFVPIWMQEFGLNKAQFGLLYALATFGSALTLPIVGKWIDWISLKKYAVSVALTLSAAYAALASAYYLPVLFLGLYGVRFSGQGLHSHVAATTLARNFGRLRGKALSIAGIGYGIGEATLPVLLAMLLLELGWRNTLWAASLFILSVSPLTILWFLKKEPKVQVEEKVPRNSFENPNSFTRRQVLADPTFYLVTPSSIMAPGFLTGLFLYQSVLVEEKGWSMEFVALAFTAYAATRSLSSLAIGPFIDKFSATKLYPYKLIPILVSLILLNLFEGPWVAFVYLGLFGVSLGAGANIKSAMWAELYGTLYLGSIRSVSTSLVIFSTASGPMIFGLALEAGVPMRSLIHFGIVGFVIVTLLAFWGCRSHLAKVKLSSSKEGSKWP